MPELPCAAALRSLPATIWPRLSGLELGGSFRASAALRFDRNHVETTDLELDIGIDRCEVRREAIADPGALRRPFAHRFPNDRRATIGRGQPGYVTLGRMPAYLPKSFVASEDGRFYEHGGFDARQIERSLAVNLRDRAFVRGGSTISQQLVKNVFLSHHRNLARKLQEAVLTWRLEHHLSKREILERYLNIIQLGPGIYGIGQAAQYWFGKPASRLTAKESAFLVALTPAPSTLGRPRGHPRPRRSRARPAHRRGAGGHARSRRSVAAGPPPGREGRAPLATRARGPGQRFVSQGAPDESAPATQRGQRASSSDCEVPRLRLGSGAWDCGCGLAKTTQSRPSRLAT